MPSTPGSQERQHLSSREPEDARGEGGGLQQAEFMAKGAKSFCQIEDSSIISHSIYR